jgi:hypothetical protein
MTIIDTSRLRHGLCFSSSQIPFSNAWQGHRDGRKTRFVGRRNDLRIGDPDGFHQLRRLITLEPSAPKTEPLLGCCLNPFCCNENIQQNLNPYPMGPNDPSEKIALSLL